MSADLLHVLGVATIASSIAVLFVLALRKPMRQRFGAQAAYSLWCVVPLVVLVALLPAPVATAPLPVVQTSVSQVLLPLIVPAVQPSWQFDAVPWLASLWALGAALCAFRFLRQQRRFLHALGPLSPGDGPLLRARSTAGCPALVGAWQPRIIVPADFDERFSAIERALIVTHEQLHRTRGDAQANLFAAVLRCLFWFNPLLHFAASRFRFDQELACDALVIARFPEARRPYADAMLKTQLTGESRQELGLPAGCYWQSSHPLKERITMLKQPLPGRARSALGLGLAAALAVCGSYAAWASQPPNPAASDKTVEKPDGAKVTHASANSVTQADSKATYRSMRRIVYPAAQVAAKIEGVVYVKAHIGTTGDVTSAIADRFEPDTAAVLADTATGGVRTWRFNPAERGGKPVASDEIIPVVFALHPDAVRKISGGTLDPIRVAPPDEPGAASADHPPTEDVTFRKMHPPRYPEEAVRNKQSAELVFKVLVDEHGVPQSVDIEHSDPPAAEKIFAQASIDAIMQWRFNPAIKDGKPHDGYVQVPITFSLKDMD
jgi:bla regulator protein BlaR1